VSAVGLYLFLRWVLHPLAVRLPTGVGLFVDAAGALLLVPEYACTTVIRRLINRPAPFAFLYGEIVCAFACVLHGTGLTIADALRKASARIGHTQAVIGGLIGALCLILLS
jgi:hypothetical protein